MVNVGASSARRVRILSVCLAVLALEAVPASAATIFFDGTFNLADYTTVIFQNNPATITPSQILAGGNPGAALQVLYDVPASSSPFGSLAGFVNTTFAYDPSTDGALQSIDVSVDKYFVVDGTLLVNTFRPLTFQGGAYYRAAIPILDLTEGAWISVPPTTLNEADFTLFDFTTGTSGSGNPDFAGGPMLFGFATGLNFNLFVDDNRTADVRHDNLRFELNQVPEPASGLLILSGVAAWTAAARRRKAKVPN